MKPKHDPGENEAPDSEAQAGGESLSELEHHISQRISHLSDSDSHPSVHQVSALEFEQSIADTDFLPPFEPPDPYDYQALPRTQGGYGKNLEGLHAGYEPTGALLKGIQDLNDLLTDSILNLNVRLCGLEENLAAGNEFNSEEIQSTLRDFKDVIQEVKQRPAGIAPNKDKQTGDLEASALPLELEQQLKLLDSHLEKLTGELKKSLEERLSYIAEQIRMDNKILQRTLREDREASHRHILSLAVLLLVVIFLAGAIIIHSVDHLSSLLAQQQDSLQIQLEQLTNNDKNRPATFPVFPKGR